MKDFKTFLSQKAQFYKDIEFHSVLKAFAMIRNQIDFKKVVHIVGTNGKGSTGRALAYMLFKKGQKVTHFSSPHIKSFNERIWIDGADIDDGYLQTCHEQLLDLLDGFEKKLSYFEYATLLAFIAAKKSDYLILEAGLGGEFDATNVITSDITIVTPIGYDHQEYLGNTIEQIAATKMRASDKCMVVAKQHYSQVYGVANEIDPKNLQVQIDPDFFIKGYLGENIQTAVFVLKILGYDFTKDILEGFMVPGRVQKLTPNITIDVGHNPLAALAVAQSIEYGTVLVYNSLKDKDIAAVLKILQPKIKRVEILDFENERVVDKQVIQNVCKDLSIRCSTYRAVDQKENYLVFGSFYTVEKFLKQEGL